MIKKMLSVLLALMLCMVATAAIAESPDSPSGNYVETQDVKSTGTVEAPKDFVKPVANPSAEFAAEVEALKAVAAQGGDVASYFSVKDEDLAAVLPAGTDASSLALKDVVEVEPIAYDPAYGDVSVTVKLSTAVEAGKTVVVMAGYVDDAGAVQYIPVSAVANADGTLTINFTAEQLMILSGHALTLAVLEA